MKKFRAKRFSFALVAAILSVALLFLNITITLDKSIVNNIDLNLGVSETHAQSRCGHSWPNSCSVNWENCGLNLCDYQGTLGYVYCYNSNVYVTCNSNDISSHPHCDHKCNNLRCDAYPGDVGCDCELDLCYCFS